MLAPVIDLLEELIEKIFLEHPHEEWLRRLRESRLPHGEIKGIAEVLAHPQVIARQMIREMESPVGPVPVIGSPLRLADSPARFDRIPALGQDTESILRELGYSDGEIETKSGGTLGVPTSFLIDRQGNVVHKHTVDGAEDTVT